MLMPSLIGWVSCKLGTSDLLPHEARQARDGAPSTSVGPAGVRAHLEQDLARAQRPSVEQPVERGTQQPSRIGEAAGVVEAFARERQQRRAAKISGFPPPLHRSAPPRLRGRSGSCVRARAARRSSPRARGSGPSRVRPAGASRRSAAPEPASSAGACSRCKQRRVGVEQRRMGVVPLQQLEQQFVRVEAAHEPLARASGTAPLPRRGEVHRSARRPCR